jgi:hypothetical protein
MPRHAVHGRPINREETTRVWLEFMTVVRMHSEYIRRLIPQPIYLNMNGATEQHQKFDICFDSREQATEFAQDLLKVDCLAESPRLILEEYIYSPPGGEYRIDGNSALWVYRNDED